MLQRSEIESHEMQLQRVLESGAQEWLCPSCGRHLLLWFRHPDDRPAREILVDGDETAIHTGGTRGLRISGPTLQVGAEPASNERALPPSITRH